MDDKKKPDFQEKVSAKQIDVPGQRAAQRKRLFTVVAAVGAAAIVLGIAGLLNAINAPFENTKNSNTVAQANPLDELDQLKKQDTDGDGLSDYDEIFTYHTSVFVKDSDSDGKADGEEVNGSSNPNCPEGATCGSVPTTNGNTNASVSAQAAALREQLKKSGAPAYILNQTDDQTLLEQYRQTVGTENVNGETTGFNLQSLTAAEIRDLLQSNGVDQQSLDSVDDGTLLQIYQEALSSDQNSGPSQTNSQP